MERARGTREEEGSILSFSTLLRARVLEISPLTLKKQKKPAPAT